MGVCVREQLLMSPPITKRLQKLGKEEYRKMVTLAKELGMTNMGDYILYCMREILECHYPAKLLPSLEV